MKRYGNLYRDVCSKDNILKAHKNARKGKSHYREVRVINKAPDEYVKQVQAMLVNKTYKTSPYSVFKRTEHGKIREIYKLPYFPDRIVHHCIMQVIEPIWASTFIRDTYASLKGRGVHDGVIRIKRALKSDPKGTSYCLKMDVRKFYPSIDRGILKQVIRRKIKDADLLWLLDEIVDSCSAGVPIGNYLSQYFGNLYLTELDHYIKEVLHCKYYYRYCDDLVILYSDKETLHSIRKTVETELNKLKLQLKDNWQVFPVASRGIDFLGYKFWHSHTLVRKRIARQMIRKLLWCHVNLDLVESTKLLSKVMSYYGWQKHANAWNLFTSLITPDFVQEITQKCGKGTVKGLFK